MQGWEYQTIQNWKGTAYQWSASLDGFLNEQGRQGWELVSALERDRSTMEWIFKRPRQPGMAVAGATSQGGAQHRSWE